MVKRRPLRDAARGISLAASYSPGESEFAGGFCRWIVVDLVMRAFFSTAEGVGEGGSGEEYAYLNSFHCYIVGCVSCCSFVWTKEPKATATRKSRGRPLGGLKRAPKAVLQAKRPRFSDGPDEVFSHGKGYGGGVQNTSCSRFGPSVALLRVCPFSPISARRETHAPPASHMKIGYRTSSSPLLPPNRLRRISSIDIGPHENLPWYWPALPLKEQCMFPLR